ncbi:MAG: TIGR01244 family phosphatase, partial [Sandarakinorhabdus sp.]|nr:TIGR01244 family phosphatase [Sandarakinorhabdus sp.]
MFIHLTDAMSVAAQIAPEDCALAADAGFAVVICNRPDAEDPEQPEAAVIRAAAAAAGLRYVHIPVDA